MHVPGSKISRLVESDIARSHQSAPLARRACLKPSVTTSRVSGAMSARCTCDAETLAASNEEIKTASTWIRYRDCYLYHDGALPRAWKIVSLAPGVQITTFYSLRGMFIFLSLGRIRFRCVRPSVGHEIAR